MSEYQVLARKYRPQTFRDVIGQETTVSTLINAIKHKRLGSAYLFCGSKGTGKTTLARIFAKALNCSAPTTELEPCNACQSCKEIASGNSIDVLEIDGASNRGIDDIRKITETVSYTTASGHYKVYIIDEVHMLTKDAFNALLKTLEEPPPKVIFFFATTEPHKVIPTIVSRCQRFNLNRIPTEKIIKKLSFIINDLGIQADENALRLLANRAEGGLRDAESLLDQVLAFHQGALTEDSVAAVLGIMPRDTLFALDIAGKEGDLGMAFTIADSVFSGGKDLPYFLDMLTEHFRNLLIVKLSGPESKLLSISDREREKYKESAAFYRQDQCVAALEYLIEMQGQIRFSPSSKIALEAILLHIIRLHHRIPIDMLVNRLNDLECKLRTTDCNNSSGNSGKVDSSSSSSKITNPFDSSKYKPTSDLTPIPPKYMANTASNSTAKAPSTTNPPSTAKTAAPTKQPSPPEEKEPAPIDLGARPTKEAQLDSTKKQSQYDTILQFAAVELEGKLQKK